MYSALEQTIDPLYIKTFIKINVAMKYNWRWNLYKSR